MKAIIIAAGSGKRISKNVKNVPKSMVLVNGKPIIKYQISVLKQIGIDDIIVITGPHSEKFLLENIFYINDQKYSEHDILGSLMEAKKFLKNDVLILYSDIIFEKSIVQQILKSKGDISIAVDMNWEKMYEGRTEHPVSEAENVQLTKMKKISRIKKNIKNKNNDVGEFLGIMKMTKKGGNQFVHEYEKLVKNHKGNFHEATSISKAYVTDMIQELVELKINVEPVLISGKWCEIDTMQDLKNAEKIFS